MQHTLSLLLQNQSGALVRVVALFAERHCNIDALHVTTTHDPTVSRLIIMVTGSAAMLDQIVRHICKLVDVIDVHIQSQDDTQAALTHIAR